MMIHTIRSMRYDFISMITNFFPYAKTFIPTKKSGSKKMQQAKDKTDNSVNSPDEHMHKILG